MKLKTEIYTYIYIFSYKSEFKDKKAKTKALRHFKVDPVLKNDTTLHSSLDLYEPTKLYFWLIIIIKIIIIYIHTKFKSILC